MNANPSAREQNLPNGAAIAAMLAAMTGILALAAVATLSEASPAIATAVHGIGKLWIPGAEGIGPYSGKETVALVAWLGSWLVLHRLLKDRELMAPFWLAVFLVGVGLGTTFIWPPVWHMLFQH